MTNKPVNKWKYLEVDDTIKIEEISKIFEIPTSLAKILFSRGITTKDEAKKFFYPTKFDLYDPFLMKDMQKAIDRIKIAIENKDKILIYGDYDVDGTNGAAMLFLFFKNLGLDVDFFIPDRIKDGYGISNSGIQNAVNLNISLLISVDCGITATEQVNLANKNNIDVIICDHHEPSETIPSAIAILNPMQKDCNYPFKYLCGCGVAFKFISAIIKTLNLDLDEVDFTDFVALASTADVVPLIDENRTLVKLGLEKINSFPRPGIKALLEFTKNKNTQLSSSQIVFQLAPRINAVGRLGSASRAVKLLISKDLNEAREYAKILNDENNARKLIDEEVLRDALIDAEKYVNENKGNILVLYNPDWHSGVVGIVASRIVEKYYRPTILLTNIDGIAKGSARSINGFNIHDALKQCSNLLLQFGGHKYAAGLSLEIDKIDLLRDQLQIIGQNLITEDISTPNILIDAIVEVSDLNQTFLDMIKLLAPYGPNNMRPNFLIKNAPFYGNATVVGKNHLKFKIFKNGSVLDCIGFGLSEFLELINNRTNNIEFIFSIDENEFNGITLPQLKIRDVKSQNNINEN